jgi:carbon-monoxide dehydrogenase large subunit
LLHEEDDDAFAIEFAQVQDPAVERRDRPSDGSLSRSVSAGSLFRRIELHSVGWYPIYVESGEPVAFDRFGAGLASPRPEDERLVSGRGRYTADVTEKGDRHAVFVRSPHAHACIRSIDCEAARRHPGVALVLTGEDLAARDVGALTFASVVSENDGTPMQPSPRHPLALSRVLHVGDPVALVVAEDVETARDASELVEVDFEELPALVDPVEACDKAAPRLRPERPDNVVGRFTAGRHEDVARAIAAAAHVTRLRCVNNRLAVNPMEPRAVRASYEEVGGYTLTSGYQAPHLARDVVSKALGVAPGDVRVVVGDMGGGFGTRIAPYAEDVALLYAARVLQGAVVWQATRSELFLSDHHARDHVSETVLAFDGEGRILAARFDVVANLGAHANYFGANAPTHTGNRVATGVYDIPAVAIDVRVVTTNTVPTGPYRGAGRPEAIYRLERAMDVAAAEMGRNPVELRRRNLVRAEAMPYATAAGARYDSGDFEAVLDAALALSEEEGAEGRRVEAAGRGMLFGRGLACHIDTTSSMVPAETVKVAILHNGRVEILSGVQEMGQGLKTTFAQMAASRLGIPLGSVVVIQGDTAVVREGQGSYGSRSLYIGGSALALALDRLVDAMGTSLGSAWRPAGEGAQERHGVFVHELSGRRMGMAEALAETGLPRLQAEATFRAENCFPNGCYVCEVEIDPETGRIAVTRFVAVDDVGTVMHPKIVHGQIHGGIAQGIGQAILEDCHFDEEGQLVSGSFMDYAMPRASDLPLFDVGSVTTLSPTNPLGAKGGGESGSIGAPPALVNAVVDALGVFGIRHIDMPIRSQTIWRAIAAAHAAGLGGTARSDSSVPPPGDSDD